MRAEKVINTLLNAASGVTALVGARIYPLQLPQDSVLPALVYEHVVSTELTTIDAASAYALMQARIEVTVLAKDYATQKTLIEEVRKALNYQRGVVAGVSVASIVRDTLGPDLRDDDLQVYSQAIDFHVTFKEQ